MREQTMTITEFLHRKEETKNIDKYIVAFLGTTLFLNKTVYAADGFEKINQAGIRFLGYAQFTAYYLFAFICLIEVLRAVASKKANEVPQVIIKYLIAFTCFYAVPTLFNVIKEIFS